MVDRIGQQLGNYRLTSLLGKGGFADVYLGEHIYLKIPAAIKVLQTKVADQDELNAFLKEAQNIAALLHPNIIRVMDFGVDNETPFLVMDYAPGGTLRQRHPRGVPLPLGTILPYVKQIADALQHAHDAKLIHRDVKPENILLGRRNDILLSDFGIALIAQSSRYQSTQDVIGTVAYMSPEQIQGKPRPASDQYSLAIVVYEWLCGTRPFSGSFTELCTQHMFAPPPPLHEKMPTILPEVEQVVTIALAKDPKQRFLTVQAFANALEQANHAAEFPTFVKPQPIPPPPPIANNPVAPLPPPIQQPIAPPPPPPAWAAQVPPFQQARLASSSTPAEVRPVTGPSGGKIGVAEGKDEKVNVWRIGKRQIVAMIVGAILCGGLPTIGYFLIHSPYQSVLYDIVAGVLFALASGGLLFFATVFGPWVGLFVGGVGSFIFSALSGTIQYGAKYFIIGLAIVGFIAGLALLPTKGRYNQFRTIATAAGISFIGVCVGVVVVLLLTMSFLTLLETALIAAAPSFIPLPIMLLVYNRIVSRRQRA